jgi:phytoene dehydrogenase-like protein
VIGTWAGPDEPGTAYVMLHHSIGDVGDGHLGSWGFQQGGMGAVSDSIHRSAESFGCEIRLNAKVSKILVRNGRFVGVALENGEELRAPVGVTTVHPKIAFLDLIDRYDLPADFVWDIERWRTRSGVVKINVALSELPDFTADPGKELQDHHTGSVAVLQHGLPEQRSRRALWQRPPSDPSSARHPRRSTHPRYAVVPTRVNKPHRESSRPTPTARSRSTTTSRRTSRQPSSTAR